MENNGSKHNGNGNGNGFGGSKSISSTVKQFVAIGFRHRRLMRTAFLSSLLAALLAVYFFGLKWESDFEILVKHDRVEPVRLELCYRALSQTASLVGRVIQHLDL